MIVQHSSGKYPRSQKKMVHMIQVGRLNWCLLEHVRKTQTLWQAATASSLDRNWAQDKSRFLIGLWFWKPSKKPAFFTTDERQFRVTLDETEA